MNLAKQIEQGKNQLRRRFKDDPYFQELERFYAEMIQKGLAKKQDYTLPLPDTVGSSFNLLQKDE